MPTLELATAVAPVVGRKEKSEEKTLIVTEVPAACVEEVLERRMDMCDIACLVFDVTKPESLQYAFELQKRFPRDMKVLFIASKGDLLPESTVGAVEGSERQVFSETAICKQCAEFVNKYDLELPLLVNKSGKDNLFRVTFECAVFEDICVPKYPEEKKSKVVFTVTMLSILVGLSWVLGLLSLVVAGGIYIMRKRH